MSAGASDLSLGSGVSQVDSGQLALAAFDALPLHIAVIDENGEILFVNRAWRDFASRDGSDSRLAGEGVNYLRVCDESASRGLPGTAEFAAGIRRVLSGQVEEFHAEFESRSPDRQRWFIGRVVRSHRSDRVLAIISHEDVTWRRQARREKYESELRYRELADSITDVFFTLDEYLMYTYWNKAAEELTGISSSEVVGKSFYEVFPQAAGSAAEIAYQETLRTGQPQILFTEFHLGREDLFFRVNVYPCRDGIMVFARDVTGWALAEKTRKTVNERLSLAQKMEAASQLVEGVAHESRSQIMAVHGFAEMLLRNGYVTGQGRESVEEIIQAADRAADLLEQLLSLSFSKSGSVGRNS